MNTGVQTGGPGVSGPLERHRDVTLVEVIDRVIDKGVVLTGDITLSVADIDLVYVGLRLLIASQDTAQRLKASTAAGRA